MSMAEFFGWSAPAASEDIPEIFPLAISAADFVKADILTIFAKILTDVLERTHGLGDDQVALMWDSCVKSSSSDGLITLVARAMADRADLFLVYEKGVGVIRLATNDEQQKIMADYSKSASSTNGVFVSFKNYFKSDMVKLYLSLEFATIAALHKSMNLSKATQIKVSDLRAAVSLADANEAKAQGAKIAKALAAGKDVLLDAKDTIEHSIPELTAVQASIDFLMQKLAFFLGMPSSYLSGEQTGGLGTTGEGDQKAVERGLKAYYFSVMKPLLEALFQGTKLSYKSQDFRQTRESMDVLKTFALVDDQLISAENKRRILNGLLDLPEDAEGDPAPKAPPAPDPKAPAVVPPAKARAAEVQ